MENVKITHYLNKKLKSVDLFGEAYPVYVRILWGREVIRIKSVIANQTTKQNDYLKDDQFNHPINKDLFKIESDIINYIFQNDQTPNIKLGSKIKSFIKSISFIFLDAINFEFDEILSKYEQDPELEKFPNALKKQFVNSFDNPNTEFINQSFTVKLHDFELLHDFSFIEDDKQLRTICETLKSLIIFSNKFYSDKQPLSVFEWITKKGATKFHSFVEAKLKTDKTYLKLMHGVNDYLETDFSHPC